MPPLGYLVSPPACCAPPAANAPHCRHPLALSPVRCVPSTPRSLQSPPRCAVAPANPPRVARPPPLGARRLRVFPPHHHQSTPDANPPAPAKPPQKYFVSLLPPTIGPARC